MINKRMAFGVHFMCRFSRLVCSLWRVCHYVGRQRIITEASNENLLYV